MKSIKYCPSKGCVVENHVEDLCKHAGEPQRSLGLSDMVDTITNYFPMAQIFVFSKFLFLVLFFQGFSILPTLKLVVKKVPDSCFGEGPD